MELMRQLGLAPFADFLPHQLSGGMRQRVAIGRAFAQNPDLLLMDEPFGALDTITRTEVQTTLLDLYSASECTVVMVTHDVEEALILADRIAVLSTQPGTFIENLVVPFARPRNPDLRWSQEFVAIRRSLVTRLQVQARSLSLLSQLDTESPNGP
jgi:NitT/TauT family transport system ATP-binding protein